MGGFGFRTGMCLSTFLLFDMLDLSPTGHLPNTSLLDIMEDINGSQPSLYDARKPRSLELSGDFCSVIEQILYLMGC